MLETQHGVLERHACRMVGFKVLFSHTIMEPRRCNFAIQKPYFCVTLGDVRGEHESDQLLNPYQIGVSNQ